MSSIPYGYRIENGRPAVIPENAVKIRLFLLYYLEGNAIDAAGKTAGIPLCRQALTRFLKDGLYAGAKGYPAIISRKLQQKAFDAWKERTHPGNKRCRQPVRVRRTFRLRNPRPELLKEPPEKLAEKLYALVTPTKKGSAVLNRTEETLLLKKLSPGPVDPGEERIRDES